MSYGSSGIWMETAAIRAQGQLAHAQHGPNEAPPPDRGPAFRALQDVSLALEQATARAQALERRLGPVLRPAMPTPNGPSGNANSIAPAKSPLGDLAEQLMRQVLLVEAALQDITERLEV